MTYHRGEQWIVVHDRTQVACVEETLLLLPFVNKSERYHQDSFSGIINANVAFDQRAFTAGESPA